MTHQKSCKPNTGNAGNWYSFPAATAGGSKSSGNEESSICPKGWQLTVDTAIDPKSWFFLFRNTYSIMDDSDKKIHPLPFSFVNSGWYNQGSFVERALIGNYWSSTTVNNDRAKNFYHKSNYLRPQGNTDGDSKKEGLSLRCVLLR